MDEIQRNNVREVAFGEGYTMNLPIIILGAALWFIVGILSFTNWWTSEFDLTTNQLFLIFVSGIFGPFAFLIGWMVHGSSKDIILVKKR